jgi:2-dehydropantoate 2-reductase
MGKDKTIEKICIFGVGGVGGFFGGQIACRMNAEKDANLEAYFVARGSHLDAINRNGLTVITPNETLVGKPTLATDDIDNVPDPDLILLCVKGYGLEEAVKAIGPKVNKETIIVPLLNGADIHDRIRVHLDTGIVLPACVYVGTHIERPGVISQNGGDGKILFGKGPGFPDFKAENVVKFFEEMGFNFEWNDDPFPAIWSKYIFIAAYGLATVYTGKTIGGILTDEKAKKLTLDIMQEIKAIADKKRIDLPATIIEDAFSKGNNFPFETKTSYQRDVETKGKLNEGDLYGGTIVREGESLGVATPVTASIYSEIRNRLGG